MTATPAKTIIRCCLRCTGSDKRDKHVGEVDTRTKLGTDERTLYIFPVLGNFFLLLGREGEDWQRGIGKEEGRRDRDRKKG